MWSWDYSLNIDKKFIDYHMSSINAHEYTSTQVYEHRTRKVKENYGYKSADLSYPLNLNDSFEKVLFNRRTWVDQFPNERMINKDFIARFSQLSFIGGKRQRRTYPSGGAQYYVNIHYLFNEDNVHNELWSDGNISELNTDTSQLLMKKKVPWSKVKEAFIQGYLASTAQFAIVLSVNLQCISKKYTDISYKLVQQEAGHIGQNIQLVATYLGIQAVPLGGFYDLELSNLIEEQQTVLYAFLLG